MKKQKLFLITLLYFCTIILWIGAGGELCAQQRQLDSLLTELKHNSSDNNEKLQTLNALSFTYSTMQLDSGIAVADRAIALAKKLDNQKELAAAYNYKALNIIEKSNDSLALQLLQQSLAINTSLKNNRGIADNYYCMAYFKNYSGDSKGAMDLLQKAIVIYQKENYVVGLAWTNYEIGFVKGNFNDLEGSLKYKKEGIKISEKEGYDVGLGICYDGLGGYYYKIGDYAKSFECYNTAIKVNKKNNCYLNLGCNYSNIANSYISIGDYPKALSYSLNALRLAEANGCLINQGFCMKSIGKIYSSLNQFDKALEYTQRSIEFVIKANQLLALGYSYNNLGTIYTQLNNPDSAFHYFDKAMEIVLKTNSEQLLSYTYTYSGEAYREFKKYDLAILTFQKALILDTRVYGKATAAEDLYDLGKSIMMAPDASLLEAGIYPTQRFETAIAYFQQALKDATDAEIIRDSHFELSNIYEKQGDLKKSMEYYKKYIVLKDSISNSNNTQSIANMQMQYDTEKKEQQIALLNKDKAMQQTEIEKQKTTRNSFAVGFLLVLLIAGVTYNRYRIKQKANKEIEHTLMHLKNSQEQLVQQGKLAALGKMTSDVATEIKNPLNLVKQISSESENLIDDCINAKNEEEQNKILDKLQINLNGINQHGKIADGIVKNILMNSRQ